MTHLFLFLRFGYEGQKEREGGEGKGRKVSVAERACTRRDTMSYSIPRHLGPEVAVMKGTREHVASSMVERATCAHRCVVSLSCISLALRREGRKSFRRRSQAPTHQQAITWGSDEAQKVEPASVPTAFSRCATCTDSDGRHWHCPSAPQPGWWKAPPLSHCVSTPNARLHDWLCSFPRPPKVV